MTRQELLGRPPLAPLARAAAALAGLVRPLLASPPLRPSETAAGFLRGMGAQSGNQRLEVGGFLLSESEVGHPAFRAAGFDRDSFGGEAHRGVLKGIGAGELLCRHEQIIPKPLWVVKGEIH